MGIPLTGNITTTDVLDTFPTHLAELGKGGHRTVATLADRDAIPTDRLEEGMTVYVEDNQTTYQLIGGVDVINWIEHGVPDLKTINGDSLLGAGDLALLKSTDLKTINGNSLIGEGDISIVSGSSASGSTLTRTIPANTGTQFTKGDLVFIDSATRKAKQHGIDTVLSGDSLQSPYSAGTAQTAVAATNGRIFLGRLRTNYDLVNANGKPYRVYRDGNSVYINIGTETLDANNEVVVTWGSAIACPWSYANILMVEAIGYNTIAIAAAAAGYGSTSPTIYMAYLTFADGATLTASRYTNVTTSGILRSFTMCDMTKPDEYYSYGTARVMIIWQVAGNIYRQIGNVPTTNADQSSVTLGSQAIHRTDAWSDTTHGAKALTVMRYHGFKAIVYYLNTSKYVVGYVSSWNDAATTETVSARFNRYTAASNAVTARVVAHSGTRIVYMILASLVSSATNNPTYTWFVQIDQSDDDADPQYAEVKGTADAGFGLSTDISGAMEMLEIVPLSFTPTGASGFDVTVACVHMRVNTSYLHHMYIRRFSVTGTSSTVTYISNNGYVLHTGSNTVPVAGSNEVLYTNRAMLVRTSKADANGYVKNTIMYNTPVSSTSFQLNRYTVPSGIYKVYEGSTFAGVAAANTAISGDVNVIYQGAITFSEFPNFPTGLANNATVYADGNASLTTTSGGGAGLSTKIIGRTDPVFKGTDSWGSWYVKSDLVY